MQHEGIEKYQLKNGSTIISYPKPEEGNLESGWKDHKPYGTYVEVSAIYRNRNTTSIGKIIYRFMLGQDIHKDYNAKRNTHYKLTLEFHGNGNEADWHIEYDEDPGIYVVSPQYISYLYNKEMQMDVKVVGDIDPDYGLKAMILNGLPGNRGATGHPISPLRLKSFIRRCRFLMMGLGILSFRFVRLETPR